MTGIFWTDGSARLKTFSAAVKPTGRAILKIEVEVLDSYELGHLIENLNQITRSQAEPRRPKATAPLLLEHRKEGR